MEEPKKKCGNCKILKGITEYSFVKKGGSSRRSQCKDCRRIKDREYRKKLKSLEKPIRTEKECTKCKLVKKISKFQIQNTKASGYSSQCKDCIKDTKKSTIHKNRTSNKKRSTEDRKCRVCKKFKSWDSYYNSSISKSGYSYDCKECDRKSSQLRSKRRNELAKHRRNSNPLELLKDRLRSRTYLAFKTKNYSKSSKTRELIGCNWETLKLRIESQFSDGMSWDNRSKWQIDHIIPLSSAKTEGELIKLCHYTNLQPLWESDNKSKGCRLDWLSNSTNKNKNI